MIREQVADYLKGVRLTTKVDKNDVAFFIRYPVSSENMAEAIVGLLCAEIEKMGLTQNGNPYYFVEAGSYRPQGLQVYSDREIKLMREAFNVGRTAQLQKILNKLKEGAE